MASPLTDQEKVSVGFSCQLVEPSSPNLQTECPVCLQIIREPYQVTCCGKKFCQSCIQTVKDTNKPCPTCNNKNYTSFIDKGFKQLLCGLKVRCSHQKEGCEWTGELGQLDEHLNTNPLPEKTLEGCPLTTINCEFHHVGCKEKLKRKHMFKHLEENLPQHTSLLAASLYQFKIQQAENQAYLFNQVETLNSKLNNFAQNFPSESEMTSLRSKVDTLDEKVKKISYTHNVPRVTIPEGPPSLLMTNFTEYKQANKLWFSDPVYTHHEGYKICLAVRANGHGGHVTVCVRFMKGEYDDYLEWPFRGKIHYKLLDQLNQEKDKSGFANYDYRLGNTHGCRVTATILGTDIAEQGWSHTLQFIAHSELEPKYLKNDTLKFQVYKVELESSA